MEPAPSPQGSANRVFGLDAARALAVIAMVFGHTMHATLSSEAMQVVWVQRYWHVRSFTGPLFLFLSGWVLFLVVRRRGLVGMEVLRAYLPRVTLLFAIGYLVRLPIWNLRGLLELDPELWRYFSTFDALQCIAASMLATLTICAVTPSFTKRLIALGVLAAVIVGTAGWIHAALANPRVPAVFAQTFGGGSAHYPFLPWSAYFFAGALIGALVTPQGSLERARLNFAARAGAVVVLLMLPLGAVSRMAALNPWRFVGSVGIVLVVIALICALPSVVGKWLAPVGRASLWAYVIHLPIVYGWGYWSGLSIQVGPILSDLEALTAAICVVGFSVTAAVLAQRALGRGRWRRGVVRGFELASGFVASVRVRVGPRSS